MTREGDQKQDDEIQGLKDQYEEIMKILKPIADTYKTVNTLGRWLMAFLVLVSILFGITANWTTIKGLFVR